MDYLSFWGGIDTATSLQLLPPLVRFACRFSSYGLADVLPDHETDAVIQNALRKEVGPDVTVLTIAHRLQTIADADRIVSPSFFFHVNDT